MSVLFRQSQGFEGFGPVCVADSPSNDATIMERPYRNDGLFHLDAALFPFAEQAADGYDAIASVNKFERFGAEFFPYLVRVGRHLSEALYPDVGRWIEHPSTCVDQDRGIKKRKAVSRSPRLIAA